MSDVNGAIGRLFQWLPLRTNASFAGAFDAIYRGAHDDVLTLVEAATRLVDERDAGIARAEQLDHDLAKVMADYQDLEDQTPHAVSRADIEKAIWDAVVAEGGNMSGRTGEWVTNAMCDLFGIEAEQSVDIAEEMIDTLAGILYDDALVTNQMRGVLERVVRAGMIFPDEADR